MAVKYFSKIIIQNDTLANVELNVGEIVEFVLGRNSSTGAIGYSIDAGLTWTWLPIGDTEIVNWMEPVTNGDVDNPEILFDIYGDVIMAEVNS